jgi:hypothetical protein
VFTLLSTAALFPQLFATINAAEAAKDPQTTLDYILMSQVVVLAFSIAFLVDGVLRLKRSIKEGESIRKRLIFVIILVYGASILQCTALLVITARGSR